MAWTVRHAYAGSPFFRDLLDGAGLDPESVSGVADLPSLPFTDGRQLRDVYPFGWTAVEVDEIVRVHASRGATGKLAIATYTANDLDDWAEQSARCLRYAGVTLADRVQITAGYGLWAAGAGFQAGAEWLGAMAVPAGPGALDLQLELMIDFQTTVLCATSSFALSIAEEVERRGVRDRLALRVGLFGLGARRRGAPAHRDPAWRRDLRHLRPDRAVGARDRDRMHGA
ncbi:MAG: hypothetical protein GEU81_10175 [Nitriliruptorales bacterium]|nr:hypothetical protein [Nitriliruptorales bacterium]